MEKIRVSKLMSEQGLCSRREADSYIERGWVLVDGQPGTELGTRAYRTQSITLAPAGRLDIDSQGLLVLTQDGRIAKQLIGENSGTAKEYLVRVQGKLPASALALLNFGLRLDGGAPQRRRV